MLMRSCATIVAKTVYTSRMTTFSAECLHRLRPRSDTRLDNAAWRAACDAGVALHRPTHPPGLPSWCPQATEYISHYFSSDNVDQDASYLPGQQQYTSPLWKMGPVCGRKYKHKISCTKNNRTVKSTETKLC